MFFTSNYLDRKFYSKPVVMYSRFKPMLAMRLSGEATLIPQRVYTVDQHFCAICVELLTTYTEFLKNNLLYKLF